MVGVLGDTVARVHFTDWAGRSRQLYGYARIFDFSQHGVLVFILGKSLYRSHFHVYYSRRNIIKKRTRNAFWFF
jgi:hypothetical protein